MNEYMSASMDKYANKYMSEVEWMRIFGQNLKEILEERRMSQKRLAMKTGLSEATISAYIKARRMPSAVAIVNISYVLGINLYDLIDFGYEVR